MTEQSFVLDYEKIRQFREKSCQSVNECIKMIDTLQTQMDLMQQMDAFQGEAATGIKNYFEEVHKTILNSIKVVLEDFDGKMNLYANQFIENVDSELDARIPEEALEEMKNHIRFTFFELDDIIEDINKDFCSISDIVELESLSTEEIQTDYQKKNG